MEYHNFFLLLIHCINLSVDYKKKSFHNTNQHNYLFRKFIYESFSNAFIQFLKGNYRIVLPHQMEIFYLFWVIRMSYIKPRAYLGLNFCHYFFTL